MPEYEAGVPGGVNSGENGSILKIPFFRPWFMRGVENKCSRNAVYYRGSYVVHHILLDPTTMGRAPAALRYTPAAWENADNWTTGSGVDSNYLVYNSWTAGTKLTIDQEPLIQGDLVGVLHSNYQDQSTYGGIYQVRPLASDLNKMGLFRLRQWNTECEIVSVWQGQV